MGVGNEHKSRKTIKRESVMHSLGLGGQHGSHVSVQNYDID